MNVYDGLEQSIQIKYHDNYESVMANFVQEKTPSTQAVTQMSSNRYKQKRLRSSAGNLNEL